MCYTIEFKSGYNAFQRFEEYERIRIDQVDGLMCVSVFDDRKVRPVLSYKFNDVVSFKMVSD